MDDLATKVVVDLYTYDRMLLENAKIKASKRQEEKIRILESSAVRYENVIQQIKEDSQFKKFSLVKDKLDELEERHLRLRTSYSEVLDKIRSYELIRASVPFISGIVFYLLGLTSMYFFK